MRLVSCGVLLGALSFVAPGGSQASGAERAVTLAAKPKSTPTFEVVGKPVPFVPYQLSDLRAPNGRQLQPDAIITLGDGTKVSAAEAIRRLNLAEKQVTAAGSTLRGGLRAIGKKVVLGPSKVSFIKRPVRYRMVEDRAALRQQRREYVSRYKPKVVAKLRSAEGLAREIWNKLKEGGGVRRPQGEEPNCRDKEESVHDQFSVAWGSASTFQASMAATIDLKGKKTRAKMTGTAKAGGSLFGIGFDLFNVSGTFVGPQVGPGTGDVRITVLGKDLFNGSTPPGTMHSGNYKSTVKVATRIPIATLLGLVSIEARVGVKGEAGARFLVQTGSRLVRGTITPYASTWGFAKAYAAARINLGIVSAKLKVGIGGKLTFLEDNMPIGGMMAEQHKPCLEYRYSYEGINAVSALSGNLYLFANAQGCAFGLCVGDHWRWDITSWRGFGPWETVMFRGSN